jgi:hypothetical protein
MNFPLSDSAGAFPIRAMLCLAALLCALNAHAFAGTPGISGEWTYYGSRDGAVRIDEESGTLEDSTNRTSYILLEEQGEQGAKRRRAARKGSSQSGETRDILRMHENVLLFLGVKNPILVRAGARFKPPREKIRGRWQYAAQMNEAFYYDAEFDLDARKMVEISRSENGGQTRSEARPLETLLDAQAECALRSGGSVYHFTRLGADFLVLEPSYALSSRNGYKILMKKAQAAAQGTKTEKARQAEKKRTAKATRSTGRGKTPKTGK